MHVSHRMHSELKRYPYSLGNLRVCSALLFVRWRADLPALFLQAFPVHPHSCVWILLRVPPLQDSRMHLTRVSRFGPRMVWRLKSAIGYSGVRSLKSISLVSSSHCMMCQVVWSLRFHCLQKETEISCQRNSEISCLGSHPSRKALRLCGRSIMAPTAVLQEGGHRASDP